MTTTEKPAATAAAGPATRSLSLYEIGEQFLALEALLHETGGEWTPDVEAWFKEYGGLERKKVDAYAGFLKSQEAYAKACKAEADVLDRKAQVALNGIRRLKEYALVCLRARSVQELAGQIWKIARQGNGGLQPMTLLEEDPTKLPDRFIKTVRSINTDALRAAAEAGDMEALTFVRLEERGEHVRIR